MTEEDIKIRNENHRRKIKSLTWSVCALMFFTIAASSLYVWVAGMYNDDIPYGPLMALQGVTSIITFLLSAFVGVGISEKNICGSDATWHITPLMTIVSIVLIIVVQPLIEWGSFFNEIICSWPSMEWAKQFDVDQTSTLAKMLSFDSVSHYTITILVLAVLPAICEEFFFRGVMLRGLSHAMFTKSGSIIVSAIFFSMMHMELNAFIPRFMLGVVLGYLYLYTNSLLYPIIAHMVNNVVVLVVISKSNTPIEQVLSQATENPGPLLPIISLILTYWIFEAIFVRNKISLLIKKAEHELGNKIIDKHSGDDNHDNSEEKDDIKENKTELEK